MIEIYTDASVGKGSAVATVFILTDSSYIGYQVFKFDDVHTSIHGEILGALNALRYAESVLQLSEDRIMLYTDSIAMINLLKCNLKTTSNKQAQRYRDLLTELKSLITTLKVDVQLIHGHAVGHNPNKVVDLISNSVLRMNKKETKV